MTHMPEIGAENPYHKPTRKHSMYYSLLESDARKKSVPNCISDTPETDAVFLAGLSVFGADFWYVCHWH